MSNYEIKTIIIEAIRKNRRLHAHLQSQGALRQFICNAYKHILEVKHLYPIYTNLKECICRDMQANEVIGLFFDWDRTTENRSYWTAINNSYYYRFQN